MKRYQKHSVAGHFYPSSAEQLRKAIRTFLALETPQPVAPKALVVPHAGYVYSGQVAGMAYATLTSFKGIYSKVILLGPAHRVPLRGLALSSAEFFLTPLGRVKVDTVLRDVILGEGRASINDRAFQQEHSLEVQLPFLQEALDNFSILPLLVGESDPFEVAAILDACYDPNTLIVVSTDLTHFLEESTARAIDCQTSLTIENLNSEGIECEQACGYYALRGLLVFAQRREWKARTLALTSSADVNGDYQRVVGYGSYIFT